MGNQSSCCEEELEEVPKEVIHHRHDFAEGNSFKTCLPGDAAHESEETDESASASAGSPRAVDISLAQCRLQRMDHLVVDQEILRGITLRESLQDGGRLWRRSPLDLKEPERKGLWSRSRNVEGFDIFLSHTWQTSGIWKVLSLTLQSSWKAWIATWLLLVCLAIVLFLFDFLPMTETWTPNILGFSRPCPLGGWVMVASFLTPFLAILISLNLPESFVKSPICFLDVVSIHQTDKDLMERGIYGLGGFLQVSKELRVLWSQKYLTRLWCVFEVAAFRTANPTGKITLHPVDAEVGVLLLYASFVVLTACTQAALFWVEETHVLHGFVQAIGLIPSYFAIHVIRRQTHFRRQLLTELREFHVEKAQCRSSFDRGFIEAAILHWYGSKEKFTDYVRGPLASELIRNLTNRSSHLGYGLIIVTAPVSAGLEQCLSLWMGQAPPEALVSRFLGMVVGTDFFFCFFLLESVSLLSERLAKCACFSCLHEQVQTFLIWIYYGVAWNLGTTLGTMASNYSIWTSLAYFVTCLLLVQGLALMLKRMLLRSVQPSSVYSD